MTHRYTPAEGRVLLPDVSKPDQTEPLREQILLPSPNQRLAFHTGLVEQTVAAHA